MKRIFVIIACAATIMACGGNKTQSKECGECKTECSEKKECSKQECEKQECAQQAAGCIHLDTDGFTNKVADLSKEWKYLGDKPAVVDFYADWCGPCKAVAPVLDELAKEYAGQLYIYKVNVDNDGELAQAFNISAIPTLIFIPMNGEPQITVGAPGKEEIKNKIAELLK